MNPLIKKVDVTYLPQIKDEMDDVDLIELQRAHDFAENHKARSLCTYPFLIPFLNREIYTIPICSVIDFPNGEDTIYNKVFQAGQIYELCKKSIKCELDIVLNPIMEKACNEIEIFAELSQKYNIITKFIIELSVRKDRDIRKICETLVFGKLSSHSYDKIIVKTNTGRKNNPTFQEKLSQVKWLNDELIRFYPIKIAGGINSWEEIKTYNKEIPNSIYGVSFSKLKEWEE